MHYSIVFTFSSAAACVAVLLFVGCGEFRASGEEARIRPHLPRDKQFLITKGVPCYKRVRQLENQVVHQASGDEDDPNGWFVTEVTDESAGRWHAAGATALRSTE